MKKLTIKEVYDQLPGHILPTGGQARFTGGYSLDMFYKKPSKIYCTKKVLRFLAPLIAVLSLAEGENMFKSHFRSVEIREK